MAFEVNDIDYFEELNDEFETSKIEEQQEALKTGYEALEDDNSPTEQPTYREDIITTLLHDRGISDPNHIKFEDEYGNIQDVSWDSLTLEEQRNILNQDPNYDPDTDLNDEEASLINDMRRSNLPPHQFIQAIVGNAMQQNQAQPVDDLSDDELFILDLQTRSVDITDEEAQEVLEQAKQNPTLFEKQVEGIRAEYYQLEQDHIKQQQEALQQQQLDQLAQYQNVVYDAIDNMNTLGNFDVELSAEDKDELAEFIFGQDEAGVNWFAKAINDPETLVRMAWFALKGDEAFDEISNYVAHQIKGARQQQSYQKPRVYVDHRKQQDNSRKSLGINDIDI